MDHQRAAHDGVRASQRQPLVHERAHVPVRLAGRARQRPVLAAQVARLVPVQRRRLGRQLGAHVVRVQVAAGGRLGAQARDRARVPPHLVGVERRHRPLVHVVQLVVALEAVQVILDQGGRRRGRAREPEPTLGAVHVEVGHGRELAGRRGVGVRLAREQPPSGARLRQLAGHQRQRHLRH